MNNKNKNLIILFLAILVLSAIMFFEFSKKDISPPKAKPEELLDNLNSINKNLAISIYGNDADKTGALISEARQTWQNYVDALNSQEDKPVLSRDKEKKIIAVSEYLRKADELKQEGNVAAAYEQMKLAKKNIAEIAGKKFQENDDLNAKLLDFYIEVKKMNGAKDKTQADAVLTDLKYKFTVLKGFSPDKEYNDLIIELERAIAIIDKSLDGPDFEKARDSLEPLLIKLYNRY